MAELTTGSRFRYPSTHGCSDESVSRSKLVVRFVSNTEFYDGPTDLCVFLPREVNQEGVRHIDTYNRWQASARNPVDQMTCVYEHVDTPALVQTLPSTTQRAFGAQLMLLLEFAYPEGQMISNCELRMRNTTAYNAVFIGGFVGRRLLPIQ